MIQFVVPKVFILDLASSTLCEENERDCLERRSLWATEWANLKNISFWLQDRRCWYSWPQFHREKQSLKSLKNLYLRSQFAQYFETESARFSTCWDFLLYQKYGWFFEPFEHYQAILRLSENNSRDGGKRQDGISLHAVTLWYHLIEIIVISFCWSS